MNRYYTFENGRVHIWEPGERPLMFSGHAVLDGDTPELRRYFSLPEPMIYVPIEIVGILTDGI